MSRTPDDTMSVLWTAAQRFVTVGDLPDSLRGTMPGETEDKLLALHGQVGEQLVVHAHQADGNADDLATRLRVDQMLSDAVARLVPGVSADEAMSVVLRVCAGCIDGAKAPRKDEMTRDSAGLVTKRDVSDAERKHDMRIVDSNTALDPVYAAGVAIGPLDRRIRNRQEPTFDGIDQALLDKHYHEYFRRFPPANW